MHLGRILWFLGLELRGIRPPVMIFIDIKYGKKGHGSHDRGCRVLFEIGYKKRKVRLALSHHMFW